MITAQHVIENLAIFDNDAERQSQKGPYTNKHYIIPEDNPDGDYENCTTFEKVDKDGQNS